jgi:4-hydroxy-3-methylbut-2-enyl diphosphate reductase
MRIILAKPRGFCAGVERAIKSVEQTLERYGPPIYVLNNIVHNAHVVDELRERGAIFVKDLADVPEGSNLLFSAHGVSPARMEEAEARRLNVIDATCPLVGKVHREAKRFGEKGYTVVLIGEEDHDETKGTMGWVPGDRIVRILTPEEVHSLEAPDPSKVAYVTQTTLSVDDCQRVIDALKAKFPDITGPRSDDICYATQNRQQAVKVLTEDAQLVLVVGDVESGNSNRLVDISRAAGKEAHLISDASAIDPAWLDGVETLVLTAGASAPERLVQGVIERLCELKPCEVEESSAVPEDVHFKLPAELA